MTMFFPSERSSSRSPSSRYRAVSFLSPPVESYATLPSLSSSSESTPYLVQVRTVPSSLDNRISLVWAIQSICFSKCPQMKPVLMTLFYHHIYHAKASYGISSRRENHCKICIVWGSIWWSFHCNLWWLCFCIVIGDANVCIVFCLALPRLQVWCKRVGLQTLFVPASLSGIKWPQEK